MNGQNAPEKSQKTPATWNNVLVTVARAGRRGVTNRQIANQLGADCTDVAQLTRLLLKAGLLDARKDELANIYWAKELCVSVSSIGRLMKFDSLAEASGAHGPDAALLFDMGAVCSLLFEAMQIIEALPDDLGLDGSKRRALILKSQLTLDEVRGWLAIIDQKREGGAA